MLKLEFLPTDTDLKEWSIEEVKQNLKQINEEIASTKSEHRLKHITTSKVKVLAALAQKEKARKEEKLSLIQQIRRFWQNLWAEKSIN